MEERKGQVKMNTLTFVTFLLIEHTNPNIHNNPSNIKSDSGQFLKCLCVVGRQPRLAAVEQRWQEEDSGQVEG